MNLTDRERELLKGMIDRGEPLPPKYKLTLFADAPEVELIWQGKSNEVTNVVLPFQVIEQIDEPRSEEASAHPVQLGMFSVDRSTGRQSGGWTNKLIWGDNKLVLSSLKNGPLRREIEDAAGLKLVYIDPPFDVGADFSFTVEVGEEEITKNPSLIEELAYRDTWGRGTDSYISMIHERLTLIRDVMAPAGSIVVHCDWRVNSMIRVAMDELFGPDRFINEIAWCYSGGGIPTDRMPRKHDTLLWYSKAGGQWTYIPQYRPYSEGTVQRGRTAVKGENAKLREEGTPVNDWWPDVKRLASPTDPEKLYYDTQKSEDLLNRIIELCSYEGDLVADFFCGSGTTLAVAEKLGRKWIGCDLGRFGIHTSRKRLLDVQRKQKSEGLPYRAFSILNLGRYERQFFVGIDPTLPEEERLQLAVAKEEQYLSLILSAYRAQRVDSLPHVQGRRGNTLVVVGPIDAPVTLTEIDALVTECQMRQWPKVDVLAFEYEMGLHPRIQDEAREKGVSLSLKYIPKDVFDKRAIEKNQVTFYDAAYVEVEPKVSGQSATVTLADFGVFYDQDDHQELDAKLKPGGSRVAVENGQVVKISKDKSGVISREVLTKAWSDWIDYWSVDFNYESKPEVLTITEADGAERLVRSGSYIFENEWQSFRTRKDRSLKLTSAPHDYGQSGRYKIAVKIIDIFGNDTTKVVPVDVR